MTALIAFVMILTVVSVTVRIASTVPLIRTISVAIDNWADGVQGEEPLR